MKNCFLTALIMFTANLLSAQVNLSDDNNRRMLNDSVLYYKFLLPIKELQKSSSTNQKLINHKYNMPCIKPDSTIKYPMRIYDNKEYLKYDKMSVN